MHPILAHRGRLLPYLAACAPLVAILTALFARPGGLFLGEAVALAVPLTFAYAFMGLSAWYPCRQFPLKGSRALPLVVTHAAAAGLLSATWVGFAALLAGTLGLLPVFTGLQARFGTQAIALFAAGVLLYLLAAALNYVLLALEAASEAERREAELAVLAREAELAALKAQIRPHFLFNSLNSISSLATTDPPRARQMCVRLGDFLRRSLALGEKTSISVGEELELSRAYLAVEELRFGSRLEVEEELDERGQACLVPPLLLQPLVENAVRHGIATRVEGGTRPGRHRVRRGPAADPDREPVRSGEPAASRQRPGTRQRPAAPDRPLRRGSALRRQAARRPLPRRHLRSGGDAGVRDGSGPVAEVGVLIVDDEEPARSILREHLGDLPGVRVLGGVRQRIRRLERAAELSPQIVFLDIEMPKLDGFEVLELLDPSIAAVFVTAYDEFAVRAFEVHAVDYVLKPFDPSRIAVAVERARERIARGTRDARRRAPRRGAARRDAFSRASSCGTAAASTSSPSSGSTRSRPRTTTSR